jgi:hypothetical protein
MTQLLLSELLHSTLVTVLTLGITALFFIPVYWAIEERKNVKPNPNKPWKR